MHGAALAPHGRSPTLAKRRSPLAGQDGHLVPTVRPQAGSYGGERKPFVQWTKEVPRTPGQGSPGWGSKGTPRPRQGWQRCHHIMSLRFVPHPDRANVRSRTRRRRSVSPSTASGSRIMLQRPNRPTEKFSTVNRGRTKLDRLREALWIAPFAVYSHQPPSGSSSAALRAKAPLLNT